MRFPEFLKPDGTIGFVAPSFGCSTEPYKTSFVNAQTNLSAQADLAEEPESLCPFVGIRRASAQGAH